MQAEGMPHVCIHGIGVSVLRCTAELLDYSYEVTMIEARDWIVGMFAKFQIALPCTCLGGVQIAQHYQMGSLEVNPKVLLGILPSF